jgi:hypothetical protein
MESVRYVNVNMLNYVSIQSMYGKSALFFLFLMLALLAFNFIIYRKFTSREYSL